MASVKFELDGVGLIAKLTKKLFEIHSERREELNHINNVIFCDPVELAKYYVQPDCQNTNPADFDEEEGSSTEVKSPVLKVINNFLSGGVILSRRGRNQLFVLADAGMGKSSLLAMIKMAHLTGFWPNGYDCRLYKLGQDTLDHIASHQDKARETVLLLDSLDEDKTAFGRFEERLKEILDATQMFRRVIITCRTQFFPSVDVAPILKEGHIEFSGYTCRTIYLDYFGDLQVDEYLGKRFPSSLKERLARRFLKRPDFKVEAAKSLLEQANTLQFRPFLLAHVEDLMAAPQVMSTTYAVYNGLVEQWLLREEGKLDGVGLGKINRETLRDVCDLVAWKLQSDGDRELSCDALEELLLEHPEIEALEAIDVGGRSLLNRNSAGEYRFAHYSIQEFLVAKMLVSGKVVGGKVKYSKQLFSFIKMGCDALRNIPFGSIELRMANFSGENVDKANLSGVELNGANFVNAKLTEVVASGVSLREARVDCARVFRCNFEGAVLIKAQLAGSKLLVSNFSRANFTAACLAEADFGGSVLLEAKLGLADLKGADLSRAVLNLSHLEKVVSTGSDGASAAAVAAAVTIGLAFATNASSSAIPLGIKALFDARNKPRLNPGNLHGINAGPVNLKGAIFDEKTKWPEGFDPKLAGAINVRDVFNPQTSSPPDTTTPTDDPTEP